VKLILEDNLTYHETFPIF